MAIPANICIAWPSTAASIPSGWVRETTLDARYVLGAAAGADTDLTTDRGSTTHTHTSPAHTPTQNAHTHTFWADFNTADTSVISGTTAGNGADFAHGHDSKSSASTTATNQSSTITVDAASNDLAYKEVIWIKSDGTPTQFPSGCIAFFASDTLPTNWSRVAGDRYLKGAAASSSPAADGGSNTHTHTSPPHTHLQNGHTHSATASLGGNLAATGKGTGIDVVATTGHTHSVSLTGATGTNQSVTTTINSGSHEPPYKKLNTIQSSAATLPDQLICLWLGTNATIPTDWARYTGMDGKWLKGANADGESTVTTGGATQHNHTASDCQPIQNSHTHGYTDAGSSGTTASATGSANTFAGPGHVHTWTIDSTTPTNNAAAVTIDNCTADAALPKHRTVIYVQFTLPAPPTTRTGVWTSYEVGQFDVSEPDGRVLPEVAKRISQGDLRYVPR